MINERLRLTMSKRIRGLLSGEHKSRQLNTRGHDLEEKRDFRIGDDPRSVDLMATARHEGEIPRVSIHRIEKGANVIFLMDASASMRFGTAVSKYSYASKLAYQLALGCSGTGDRFRFIVFDEKVVYDSGFVVSAAAIDEAFAELAKLTHKNCPTSLAAALATLSSTFSQSGTNTPGLVFIISDFLFELNFGKKLGTISEQSDAITLVLRDPAEISLPRPRFGLVRLVDPETGKKIFARAASNPIDKMGPILKKCGVDCLELNTGDEMGKSLENLAELLEKREER